MIAIKGIAQAPACTAKEKRSRLITDRSDRPRAPFTKVEKKNRHSESDPLPPPPPSGAELLKGALGTGPWCPVAEKHKAGPWAPGGVQTEELD